MSLPTRKELVAALRDAGLSNRQARRILEEGLPALIGEEAAEHEALKERLEELEKLFRGTVQEV